MRLPKFLKNAISDSSTSLGNHPALPPEDDEYYLTSLITDEYCNVMDGIETSDTKSLSNKLNGLISECIKEESKCKEALEELCNNVIFDLFDIPNDVITIDMSLVDGCDMSRYRVAPEKTPDFEFEDIDEMKYLTDKIYQRRMVDCIISGISLYYANNIELYIREIWKINPKLPNLYSEIYRYNMALLYNKEDSLKHLNKTDSGCVNVNVGNKGEMVKIESKGIIFPILLEYTIRGFLELASLKGLPEDREKAEYIICKADYRLAENWDMRIGLPLWKVLVSCLNKYDVGIHDLGLNFIIMEISKMNPDSFNRYMQNALKKTKLGIKMTGKLISYIMDMKDKDDFEDFIKVNNTKYIINDNADEYTSQELLSEHDYEY